MLWAKGIALLAYTIHVVRIHSSDKLAPDSACIRRREHTSKRAFRACIFCRMPHSSIGTEKTVEKYSRQILYALDLGRATSVCCWGRLKSRDHSNIDSSTCTSFARKSGSQFTFLPPPSTSTSPVNHIPTTHRGNNRTTQPATNRKPVDVDAGRQQYASAHPTGARVLAAVCTRAYVRVSLVRQAHETHFRLEGVIDFDAHLAMLLLLSLQRLPCHNSILLSLSLSRG